MGTSRPIRNREWVSFTTGLSYNEPRTEVLLDGASFRAWAIDPGQALTVWDEPTIVRMLIWPSIYLYATTTQSTADYTVTVRGGFLTWKGSTQGAIANELAGVDPNDGSLDWMWWNETHFNHFNLLYLGTSLHDFTGNSGVVNVKSKRKLESGYGLVGAWVVLADGFPNTVGVNLHMAGRVLLLNH